jgi:hypothetical protein
VLDADTGSRVGCVDGQVAMDKVPLRSTGRRPMDLFIFQRYWSTILKVSAHKSHSFGVRQ